MYSLNSFRNRFAGARPARSSQVIRRAFAAFALLTSGFAVSAAHAASYEAEAATKVNFAAGSIVADGNANPPSPAPLNAASGGYVFFDTGDSLTFSVTVANAGLYNIAVRYYVPSSFGNKYTQVYLDGAYLGETLLTASSSGSPGWSNAMVGAYQLTAGSHSIQLVRDWGYYYVDSLSVEPAIAEPAVGVHFEAESGNATGGASYGSGGGSSGGGFVTNFTTGSATLSLRVNLALPGPYKLHLGYRSPYGEKKTRVFLNGAELGEWTLAQSSAWAEAAPVTVSLPAGVSEFVFQSNWGYYDLDYLDFEYVPPAVGLSFEAETGSLYRALISSERAGFSGTGYVTNFVQSPDATVTIPVNLASGGPYQLMVRAATPFGPKMSAIRVNGVGFGEISLNTTSATFLEFPGPIVFLREGLNFITFAADWGYYDIDAIRFVAQQIPPFEINANLINPKAAPEAKALYGYLRTNFGQKILSGQSEEATGTPNRPFVYLSNLTGKQPAIRVQDMIFSSSHGGFNDGTTPRGLAWHKDLNGIISMQWHWFAPLGPTAFYSDTATFDIEKVVTPGTPENAAAIIDIDLIAAQLGQFAANRVPILWRPLHEAEGGWFWWGAKGPTPAKKLYRMLYDRLVGYHGLNNLIWVWNSKDPAWYPGDDVVDIVSADIYNTKYDYSPAPGTFVALSALGGYHKLVAMAENGPIPDPDMMFEFKTAWSWFNTWNGDFIMNELFNTNAHILAVYNHAKVITLDELPDLRAAPGVLVYGGTNYTGPKADLPPGDYNARAILTLGLTDNLIGSLKVPAGVAVILFSGDNFTGNSKGFAANSADITQQQFTGAVRSLRVVAQSAPAIGAGQSFVLGAGAVNVVGSVAATDANAGQAGGYGTLQNWQITGGTGSGLFAINAATGRITISNPTGINFNLTSYTLTVAVGDGLSSSAAQTVTISIPPIVRVTVSGRVLQVAKQSVPGLLRAGGQIGG